MNRDVELDRVPRTELEYSETFEDVAYFVDCVFPDTVLPLPVDQILDAFSGHQPRSGPMPLYLVPSESLDVKGRWTTFPDLGTSPGPSLLARFFNEVGDKIAQVCKMNGKPVPRTRRRWSGIDEFPLVGRGTHRAPDLFLHEVSGPANAKRQTQWQWSDVLAYGILGINDAIPRLSNRAYYSVTARDDRRFNLSIAFEESEMLLALADRDGVIGSLTFDIHEDPEQLIRVLTGLMLASRDHIGYDTSIICNPHTQRRTVKVAGETYELTKSLFIRRNVAGPGTVCWLATRDGANYVIRDTWVQQYDDNKEESILELVKDIDGVVHTVAFEDVYVSGRRDSTSTFRTGVSARRFPSRVHRRLVVTPYGLPLEQFASKKELISVLAGAVESHKRLVYEKGVLHRDISQNNIMIVDTPPLPTSSSAIPPLRKSLLIDFDCAAPALRGRTYGFPCRAGTIPAMACDILRSGTVMHHTAIHDLESFFNVLLMMCLLYDGPRNTERQTTAALEKIASWHTGDHRGEHPGDRAMADKKEAIFKDEELFKRECLDHFSLYFEDLKPCVLELRQVLFDPQVQGHAGTDIGHVKFLEILKRALESLPAVEGRANEGDADQRSQVTIPVDPTQKQEAAVDAAEEKISKRPLEPLPEVEGGANETGAGDQGLRVTIPVDPRQKQEEGDGATENSKSALEPLPQVEGDDQESGSRVAIPTAGEAKIPKRALESHPEAEGVAEGQGSLGASPNIAKQTQEEDNGEEERIPERALESLPVIERSANEGHAEEQGLRVASLGNAKRKHEDEDGDVVEEKENREVHKRKVQKTVEL